MRFSKLDALSAIRDDRILDAKERLVLVMLVAHADAAGHCYPSGSTLADETQLGERSVWAALASLKRRGASAPVWVRSHARAEPKRQGGRPPNLYTLTVVPCTTRTEPPAGSLQTSGEVPCKTDRGFPAPPAQEAGQEAGQEKLVRSRKRSNKPRLVPRPEEMRPSKAHEALAKERGVAVGEEWRKFVAYSKESGKVCADWNAAFERWLLGARSGQPAPKKRIEATSDEEARRVLEGCGLTFGGEQ